MSERHTIDFARASFNVVSDAERNTITLQFESSGGDQERVNPPIARVLKAIERRYGTGIASRLKRWRTGECNPLVLPSGSTPHPENSEVFCFEIGVEPGERLEFALATLFEFLRQQPEYQRTFGPPLDRDQMPLQVQIGKADDLSAAAQDMLTKFMERRRAGHRRAVPPNRARNVLIRLLERRRP
jgi:hypothetical protein